MALIGHSIAANTTASVVLLAMVAYTVYCIVYNIYLHPLRNIPGPRLYAISRLPYTFNVITGRLAVSLHELHGKYAPVVRTASNEVSFIEPEAWDVIYGRKNALHREFPKNYDTWNETTNSFSKTVFLASNADHPRIRKALSPAFSDRMLREMGTSFQKHIDKFLASVDPSKSQSDGLDTTENRSTDLNEWFSWLAFDLASEFVLGESFDCVQSSEHRGWLQLLSKTWPLISIITSFKSLGKTRNAFSFLLPQGVLQKYVNQLSLVGRMASHKLGIAPSQPTLMSVAQDMHGYGRKDSTAQSTLSKSEILANAELVVTAGTDTSAAALSAIVYLLASNKEAMKKLLEEIRGFPTEDDAVTGSTNSTPYLSACIHEALRVYAIVPEGLPRLSPPGGQEVCGYWIPAGVNCQVSPHAANMSKLNFTDPEKYIPERWLHSDPDANARFMHDRKTAFRPFSTGPRNCIGQNFALTTIKMTLCRLLYRFDVHLATDDDWLKQKSYLLWRRRALLVNLTPVSHGLPQDTLSQN